MKETLGRCCPLLGNMQRKDPKEQELPPSSVILTVNKRHCSVLWGLPKRIAYTEPYGNRRTRDEIRNPIISETFPERWAKLPRAFDLKYGSVSWNLTIEKKKISLYLTNPFPAKI